MGFYVVSNIDIVRAIVIQGYLGYLASMKRSLMKKKKIGLALGGGGAKGLCHIAFLKALDEMRLKPSVIAGTSIGAIIGAFYAAGVSGAQIEEIFRTVRIAQINKMVDFSGPLASAFLKGKGVERFFHKHIPARHFKDLRIPLKIVATDFWRRREVIFASGELVPAIRASMSIPGLFKPVKIGDTVLVDGGAVNPLPYDILCTECDILVAIDVSGAKTPRREDHIPSFMESIMSTFQIMQRSIVEQKMRISRPNIYIKPELKNIRVLDFYRYAEIMRGVQDDVERFRHEVTRRMRKRFLFF
jgi:NTE family protein